MDSEPADRQFDNYKWDIFCGDQAARPLIFHGTSAAYESSIRERGLTFDAVPYDPAEVAEVVRIFNIHSIYGDKLHNIGELQVYTAGSVARRTISLTFDYTCACQYGTKTKGGETIDGLWHLLNGGIESSEASFSKGEFTFLLNYRERLRPIIQAHRPMVVAVEVDLTSLTGDDLDFFLDRSVFQNFHHRLLPFETLKQPGRFVGVYLPNFAMRGNYYLAKAAISADCIRHFLFPAS
jgi:hypothetical protein